MSRARLIGAAACMVFLVAACEAKRGQAPPAPPGPPPPRQNVFALLPDAGGGGAGIVVSNPGGAQELTQPYQAVRVERADVRPTDPFVLGPEEVHRLFGAAQDVLPTPEVGFVLYFDRGTDDLTPGSESQILAILTAIRDRRSTSVTVIGHTDTTGDPQFNYQLGLRRAERVARAVRARGVDESSLFVKSHGQADLVVKTPAGVAEPRNRRVEVIVR